jgi:hypothetical protein
MDSTVRTPLDGGLDEPAAEAAPLRPMIRVAFLVSAVIAVVYALCCVVYNAPASPAQIRLAKPVKSMMDPYFAQDWMLFAPNPSTTNKQLLLEAKLKTSGSGEKVTTPIDIGTAIDRMPRDDRLFPTKRPGVILAFQQMFQNYSNMSKRIQAQAPKARQPHLQEELVRRYATAFDELRNFLSAEARVRYPGSTIVSVRATFTTQAIVPFSQRNEKPAPNEKKEMIVQTAWMPYASGIAY